LEGSSFKASPGKIVGRPLSQKTLHENRACGVAQGEGPEFKSQYKKKSRVQKPKRNLEYKDHYGKVTRK
jgi:hypothetical protein